MTIPLASEEPTVGVELAAHALNVSSASLYRAVAENRSPVAFVKTGSRISIITADLRRVLHLDDARANGNGERGS